MAIALPARFIRIRLGLGMGNAPSFFKDGNSKTCKLVLPLWGKAPLRLPPRIAASRATP